MPIKHKKVPVGADVGTASDVLFSDWKDDHDVQTGINYPLVATPAAPAAGFVTVFGMDIAGGALPSFIGPSGLSSALQPYLGATRVAMWSPAGNATTITAIGAAALTATGTATAANVATTNLHTAAKRLDYLVTTAATTAVAGFRSTVAQYFYSSTPRMGGFRYAFVFGPATGVATATNRCFVGLGSSTVAPTDVEPSTILNQFGVGWDAADANMQIMSNDGTGTATKVGLGASFPVPTADRTEMYCLQMFCAPGSTTVGWSVANLSTDITASGTFGSDMPAANTLLAPRGWMSVGGTSSVIGIALMLGYVSTDL